jgi:IgA Peptidase M64/Peptidase M64 N-terminus
LKTALLLFSFLTTIISAQNFEKFNKYFNDNTMRIDYYHAGSDKEESITVDKIYNYGIWAGSRTYLLDNFNIGRYCIKIYDAASKELIYSKGFDSYFGEYKTSEDGANGITRTYQESAIIPSPKNKIIFAVERRDKENKLFEFFKKEIDPNDVMIIRNETKDPDVKVIQTVNNGDPHSKVDIVILGEGYSKNDETKFEKDLNYFTEVIFGQEPYKSMKNDFNIYGVLKTSVDSGVDEPRANIYKNTILNCTFNSLGSERYMLTEDNKTMRDLASYVPYDAIYIMVNHKRYGGGGIYNLFCTFTTDNQFRNYLFLHEFGHSFSGLADEYYTSETSYNDFYPRGIEPVEPNITALLNPPEVKWKNLLSEGIEIPTPWAKADYDSMDYKWQKERRELNNHIADLKRDKAAEDEIKSAEEEYAQKDKAHSDEVDKYLQGSKYWKKVGAFEGAGYSSEGIYRPMLDCIMFSKGDKPFCKVCEDHIKKVIKSYIE